MTDFTGMAHITTANATLAISNYKCMKKEAEELLAKVEADLVENTVVRWYHRIFFRSSKKSVFDMKFGDCRYTAPHKRLMHITEQSEFTKNQRSILRGEWESCRLDLNCLRHTTATEFYGTPTQVAFVDTFAISNIR